MEFEKIRDVISEQMNMPKDKITLETSFVDDLGVDSLDLFQIISTLEEIFNMEFPVDDAEKIKTISDVVDYIKTNE
ncbi:MAG: acyl carrier protein [Defluviitaleaceae bacterium]|nr:acyl carrier protein [Defluviitaleaceae bacterium]